MRSVDARLGKLENSTANRLLPPLFVIEGADGTACHMEGYGTEGQRMAAKEELERAEREGRPVFRVCFVKPGNGATPQGEGD
jgi:hypothetical protein